MEAENIEKSTSKSQTRDKRSSKGYEENKKGRDKKHRKRSDSSSSRSRSRDKKKDKRKKRSSKYSSSSDSSSSSESRSRSRSRSKSSNSSSRSSYKEKIKRKDRSGFDQQPDPLAIKPVQLEKGSRFSERPIQTGPNQYSGPMKVSDMLHGNVGNLGTVYGQGSGSQSSFFNPNANAHARKLYVGNLPNNLIESDLVEYVYRSLELAGGLIEPGNPIISTKYDAEKKYIFLDFRSIEETSACLQLDGITYQGKVLKFRRPTIYDKLPKVEGRRPTPVLDLKKLGNRLVSMKVEDGPTKLFVGGFPHHLDESAIMEMLMKAGPLKSFYLVKDKMSNQSKGFGFCEYFTEQDVVKCIEMYNGYNMGQNRILQIKRSFNLSEKDLFGTSGNPAKNLAKNFLDMFNSSTATTPLINYQQPYTQMPTSTSFFDPYEPKSATAPSNNGNTINNNANGFNPNQYQNIAPQEVPNEKATNVLCINNMVNPDELEDDQEYDDIYEDIQGEVMGFGPIRSILIPRRKDGYEGSCLGKVYIEFENESSARTAKSTIKTYKFEGRNLDPTYYEPHKFMERILM